jgi:hypothetical protein
MGMISQTLSRAGTSDQKQMIVDSAEYEASAAAQI